MQPHEGGAPSGTSGELQVGQGRTWAIYPPDGLAGDSPAERGGADRRCHPVYRSAGSDQSRAPPTPPQRDRHRCPARRPRPRSDAPGPGTGSAWWVAAV